MCGRDFVELCLWARCRALFTQMQSLRLEFESEVLIWEDILGNTNTEVGKGANLEIIHKLVTAQGNCTYILLEVLGGGIIIFIRLVSSEGSKYHNIYPPFPSVIG